MKDWASALAAAERLEVQASGWTKKREVEWAYITPTKKKMGMDTGL